MGVIDNLKAQDTSMIFMIIGAVIVILALLIIFLLTGKISNLGNAIIEAFG